MHISNTTEFCVDRIQRCDIPIPILENVFLQNRIRLRRTGNSLSQALREKIMYDRVIPDISRVGGIRKELRLQGIPYEKLSNYERIYYIDSKRDLGGRTICSAQVALLNYTSNFTESIPQQQYQYNRRSQIDNSANRLVKNNLALPNRNNAEVEILQPNVIKINDWQCFSDDLTLVCLLSYSKELSEIRPAYQPVIARLSQLATKAYIYQNHTLPMDKTRLEGGRELGRYMEFIDEYRDMYQQYEDYLDQKVAPSLVLADQGRKQQHMWGSGKLVI